MPLTVSSTWVDRSATACWAAHVAANKVGRDIIVSHANRGNNTTAIRVSSGEIHNITPNVMTILSTWPTISGIMATMACVKFRSEIDRDTTCPVRNRSCPGPSRRCRLRNISTRNRCCTVFDSRPAV